MTKILVHFVKHGMTVNCHCERIFGRVSVSETRKLSVGRYSADDPNNPRQIFDFRGNPLVRLDYFVVTLLVMTCNDW